MEKILNSKIANELSEMARLDQEMRNRYFQAVAEGKDDLYYFDPTLDEKHTLRLKEIINEIGWPTISTVGEKASSDAWLIAQHADHDIVFQEQCLKLMQQASVDDVLLRNIAYLFDRVAKAKGEPQLYGTQVKTEKDGRLVIGDILEPDKLNKRRAKVGLEPIEKYLEDINTQYGKK